VRGNLERDVEWGRDGRAEREAHGGRRSASRR
jgi:hypothetical protein